MKPRRWLFTPETELFARIPQRPMVVGRPRRIRAAGDVIKDAAGAEIHGKVWFRMRQPGTTLSWPTDRLPDQIAGTPNLAATLAIYAFLEDAER